MGSDEENWFAVLCHSAPRGIPSTKVSPVSASPGRRSEFPRLVNTSEKRGPPEFSVRVFVIGFLLGNQAKLTTRLVNGDRLGAEISENLACRARQDVPARSAERRYCRSGEHTSELPSRQYLVCR